MSDLKSNSISGNWKKIFELKSSNTKQFFLSGCLAIGVGIGSVLIAGESGSSTCSLESMDQQSVTMAKYEGLNIGDTLTDVRAALGSNGSELSRTQYTSSHRWENCEFSYILAEFENGSLIKKSQDLSPCVCSS